MILASIVVSPPALLLGIMASLSLVAFPEAPWVDGAAQAIMIVTVLALAVVASRRGLQRGWHTRPMLVWGWIIVGLYVALVLLIRQEPRPDPRQSR